MAVTSPSLARFTVSFRGTAGAAAPHSEARRITASSSAWLTRGLAPSWMAASSASGESSPRPASTEWLRVSPPTTTLRTFSRAASRHICPMGTTRSPRVTTMISAI